MRPEERYVRRKNVSFGTCKLTFSLPHIKIISLFFIGLKLQTGHFIETIKAMNEEAMQQNLKVRKSNVKRIKFALNEQQRNDLLNLALKNNPKHYHIIKTQLESGMRVKELQMN